jgi:hypothetical protein
MSIQQSPHRLLKSHGMPTSVVSDGKYFLDSLLLRIYTYT